MTAEEICTKVNGTLAVSSEGAGATGVYVGEMLSDNMRNAWEDSALVTIQNHLNTIAGCTLV